ncbi:hypothetical protein IttPL_0165 [Pseudomonas phage ITTPL]|uniref:Uncharacterized protein n=1 Tax=Pseudomonas phage ITTPL TaxID=2544984 RepID=A0A5B7LVT3_9CAUD|nr:hypothetical protein QE324_gp164 [Pseudomonas phage ITTPL]QBP28179.1 hypothetical protein IttPL_0165 [Pseudomonas phage ITTPL]
MKISAILKKHLENYYRPSSFMCLLIEDDPTLSEQEIIETKQFIKTLLGGFCSVHAKLKQELREYDTHYLGDAGFLSNRCFQMRQLWWETVIEQLEEQGQ